MFNSRLRNEISLVNTAHMVSYSVHRIFKVFLYALQRICPCMRTTGSCSRNLKSTFQRSHPDCSCSLLKGIISYLKCLFICMHFPPTCHFVLHNRSGSQDCKSNQVLRCEETWLCCVPFGRFGTWTCWNSSIWLKYLVTKSHFNWVTFGY